MELEKTYPSAILNAHFIVLNKEEINLVIYKEEMSHNLWLVYDRYLIFISIFHSVLNTEIYLDVTKYIACT